MIVCQHALEQEEQLVTAQVHAFQGKYNEAAQLFAKAKQFNMAVEMYTELRKWDEAKHWAQQAEKSGGAQKKTNVLGNEKEIAEDSVAQGLILKQAASSEEDGDLRAAGKSVMNEMCFGPTLKETASN